MVDYQKGTKMDLTGQSNTSIAVPMIDAASAAEQERERVAKSISMHLHEAEEALAALKAEREQKTSEWGRRENALQSVIDMCRHGLDAPQQMAPTQGISY
jgi:acyl-CoA reductase-like NAD-dependent aldehyde dehydrogenase